MGGLQWNLGSDRFTLLWIGPGSTHLPLAGASVLVPVEPDRYRVWDGTEKSARKAAAAFIANGTREDD